MIVCDGARPSHEIVRTIAVRAIMISETHWLQVLKDHLNFELAEISDDGDSPILFSACKAGNGLLAAFLLNNGVDPNRSHRGINLLSWVCSQHNSQLHNVRPPLTSYDQDRGVFLHGDTYCRSKTDIVLLLLRHGARVDMTVSADNRDPPLWQHPWCRFTGWSFIINRESTLQLIRKMIRTDHHFRPIFASDHGSLFFSMLMGAFNEEPTYDDARNYLLANERRSLVHAFLLGRIERMRSSISVLPNNIIEIVHDIVITSNSTYLA